MNLVDMERTCLVEGLMIRTMKRFSYSFSFFFLSPSLSTHAAQPVLGINAPLKEAAACFSAACISPPCSGIYLFSLFFPPFQLPCLVEL